MDIDTLKFDELFDVESYKIVSEKKSSAKFQGFYENIVSTSIVKEQKILEKGTFIIPMNQENLISIDSAKKIIIVNPIKGIIN